MFTAITQHNNPKVVMAAATGYTTDPWSVTFYGPMGHITLNDDGTHCIGGWASSSTGGYRDPQQLSRLQAVYKVHPALTGRPLPAPRVITKFVKIDSPSGEDWGTRTVEVCIDWLGNVSYHHHGYRAGGTWVDGWTD